MFSGIPLWSRSQTSTGAIVPISATARSRNTPFGSFCAWSPSWLASSSRIASALPIAKGLKRVAVLQPGRDHEVQHAHIVLAAEAASQREHLAEQVAIGLAVHQHEARALRERIGTAGSRLPWSCPRRWCRESSCAAGRPRPSPRVPGQSMLQPMKTAPVRRLRLAAARCRIAVVRQSPSCGAGASAGLGAGSAPTTRRATDAGTVEVDDGRLEEQSHRRRSRARCPRRNCAAPPESRVVKGRMSRRLCAPVRSNCSCGPTIWRATANSMAPGRTGSCPMRPQVAVSTVGGWRSCVLELWRHAAGSLLPLRIGEWRVRERVLLPCRRGPWH